MSRRARAARGRQDGNTRELDGALRRLGASFQDTSTVGGGFPDRVVGYRGRTVLVEYKTDTGRIEPSQRDFALGWRGAPVYIVRTIEDICSMLHRVATHTPGMTSGADAAPATGRQEE